MDDEWLDEDEQFVSVEGELIAETAKAWLVYLKENDKKYWLPKSQCEWYDDHGYFSVPLWLARLKGLD